MVVLKVATQMNTPRHFLLMTMTSLADKELRIAIAKSYLVGLASWPSLMVALGGLMACPIHPDWKLWVQTKLS